MLYCEGGEALAQVAQGGWGCPLPGSIQGQVGWGFDQLDLGGGVPAYSRGLELHDLKGPFQPKPFYDSMIRIQTLHDSDSSLGQSLSHSLRVIRDL